MAYPDSPWVKEQPTKAGVYWARLQVPPIDPKTQRPLSPTITLRVFRIEGGEWKCRNSTRFYEASEIAWWGPRIDTGQLPPLFGEERDEVS